MALKSAGTCIAMALLGCGSGDPLEAEIIQDPYAGSTGLDAVSPAAAYPSGPYGVAVGDVMQEATFFGFRNGEAAEAGDLESIAISDFYDPDDAKGIDLIFVSIAAVWCGPCQTEKRMFPEIIASLQEDNLGVAFFQDLYEGINPGTSATLEELVKWQSGRQNRTTLEWVGRIDFPVVIDPKSKMSAYFDKNGIPYSLLVDAKTMKILATDAGFDTRKVDLKDKDGNVVLDKEGNPRKIYPLELFIRKHLP